MPCIISRKHPTTNQVDAVPPSAVCNVLVAANKVLSSAEGESTDTAVLRALRGAQLEVNLLALPSLLPSVSLMLTENKHLTRPFRDSQPLTRLEERL